MRALLPILAIACCLCGGLGTPARAQDASVEICFDYGCFHQAAMVISARDLEALRTLLTPPAGGADAAAERAAVGLAIGHMYAIAAAQTPIWRDRARNGMDERHLEGAMDCIDHSTNTDTFLRLLSNAGLLRHHRPGGREVRFAFMVFGEHWTASLVETASGERFAVDSWFFDPGFPAAVVGLERWKAGFDPGHRIEAGR